MPDLRCGYEHSTQKQQPTVQHKVYWKPSSVDQYLQHSTSLLRCSARVLTSQHCMQELQKKEEKKRMKEEEKERKRIEREERKKAKEAAKMIGTEITKKTFFY